MAIFPGLLYRGRFEETFQVTSFFKFQWHPLLHKDDSVFQARRIRQNGMFPSSSPPEIFKGIFAVHVIVIICYFLTLCSCQSCSLSPHEAAALLKDLYSAAWPTPPHSWMSSLVLDFTCTVLPCSPQFSIYFCFVSLPWSVSAPDAPSIFLPIFISLQFLAGTSPYRVPVSAMCPSHRISPPSPKSLTLISSEELF